LYNKIQTQTATRKLVSNQLRNTNGISLSSWLNYMLWF